MTSTTLKTQHTSLQYSDTREQQSSDVDKLFAKGQDYPIKTMTESPKGDPLHALIMEAAQDYKHEVHGARGNIVAIDREIIRKGTANKGAVFVAPNDIIVGHMHDRMFPWISFVHEDEGVGRIFQAAAHYPTKGQTPNDPNHDINRRYAREIAGWMERVGAGAKRIAFVNGDFNMPDNRLDWAFGRAYTSMADELKAWSNTGHGPIDGFCSYDRDRRVKPRKFTVLDDSEMHMHTDHFVCRGVWTVGHLS